MLLVQLIIDFRLLLGSVQGGEVDHFEQPRIDRSHLSRLSLQMKPCLDELEALAHDFLWSRRVVGAIEQ